MTFVVTFDPGLTTGVVSYATPAFDLDGVFTAREMTFDEVGEYLRSLVNDPAADTVFGDVRFVCESFIITMQTAKNTQAPWSLELIGVIRHYARTWFAQDPTMQQPAAAKRFASDARLKHAGFHTPGKGHANDAARHLLLYAVTRKLLPQELVMELAEV